MFQRNSHFDQHLINRFKSLTLYHTVPAFNTHTHPPPPPPPEEKLVSSIFSFSHKVFYPIRDINLHLKCFYLSSANAFSLVMSKILLFGKEFICLSSVLSWGLKKTGQLFSQKLLPIILSLQSTLYLTCYRILNWSKLKRIADDISKCI